jgi:hypothetical protein
LYYIVCPLRLRIMITHLVSFNFSDDKWKLSVVIVQYIFRYSYQYHDDFNLPTRKPLSSEKLKDTKWVIIIRNRRGHTI